MALDSTRPLTEMSTRNISWRGKSGRCAMLTILPPSCADCHEIWEPKVSGTLRVSQGIKWTALPFGCSSYIMSFRFPRFHMSRPDGSADIIMEPKIARKVSLDHHILHATKT